MSIDVCRLFIYLLDAYIYFHFYQLNVVFPSFILLKLKYSYQWWQIFGKKLFTNLTSF